MVGIPVIAYGSGAYYNKCFTSGPAIACVSNPCFIPLYGLNCVQDTSITGAEWCHTCSDWGMTCSGSPAECVCLVGGWRGKCPHVMGSDTCP